MLSNIRFSLAVLLAVACFLAQSASPANTSKSLTLLLQPSAGAVVCEFQGKVVPAGQLLNVLGSGYEKDGPSIRLNILVHQDIALTEIFRVQASVGKVGFTNTKVFCFDRNRQAIWELSFGPQRPFTVKP